MLNSYNTLLKEILDTHAPECSKTIVVKPKMPWMSDDIKTQKSICRQKERSWKTALKNARKNPTTENNDMVTARRSIFYRAEK